MDPKGNKAFFDFCYDQYKIESEEVEKIYSKVAILLIVIPILGGIAVRLGRIEIVAQLFQRIDIFLYYVFFVITWILLSVSIFYSVYCVIPRKNYLRIGDLKKWEKWKSDYEQYIQDSGGNETIEEALFRDICPKLADAQTRSSPINEKRRSSFQKAVFFASLSIIPVGLQAIFYLILKLHNIL